MIFEISLFLDPPFSKKLALLSLKELHGLHGDLKNPSRYPDQQNANLKNRRICRLSTENAIQISLGLSS